MQINIPVAPPATSTRSKTTSTPSTLTITHTSTMSQTKGTPLSLPAYVLPAHYPPGFRTYAANIRAVKLQFGQGSNVATVYSTVDTGSGFVDISCNTPATGTPVKGVYTFSNAAGSNVNASTCDSLQAGGCMVGENCWWSSGVSGKRITFELPFPRSVLTFLVL